MISTQELEGLRNSDEKFQLVDVRSKSAFSAGFIPGSIFLGAEGKFESWARVFVPVNDKVILVTESGNAEEVSPRFFGLGYKNIDVLEGGFKSWQNEGFPIDMVIDVEADELAMDLPHDSHLRVVDVRTPVEYGDNHIKEAENIPLDELADPAVVGDIEDNDNLYIHCKSGYRSLIAASILKQQGLHNLRNVVGGFEAIQSQKGFVFTKSKESLN